MRKSEDFREREREGGKRPPLNYCLPPLSSVRGFQDVPGLLSSAVSNEPFEGVLTFRRGVPLKSELTYNAAQTDVDKLARARATRTVEDGLLPGIKIPKAAKMGVPQRDEMTAQGVC